MTDLAALPGQRLLALAKPARLNCTGTKASGWLSTPVVLNPKRPLRGTTVLFVQMMLSLETWRYSYGRKWFKEKC